eukprot:scaffold60_cov137-Skeletonema_marinoi.AAC.8
MVGQRYTGASTANKSVDPPQAQIGQKQKHPIEGQRKEGFAKAGGHRTLFVFIIVAFINTGMLMSFGFPAGISKCEPLAIVAPDESISTEAADAENEMTALDRRMLKYFQSYFYVPPVPNKALGQQFPAKECGAAPAFDGFFALNSQQRSANNEDKWIYENLFKGKNISDPNKGNNAPGTYVEIGAFDGMRESNSRFFEMCLGWEGLLVEGQPGNYRGVLRDRPFAHKMSFAPSCDAEYERVNKTVQFANYPMTNSGLKGHAKTYDAKPHVDVPCGPFTPVLEDIFAFSNKRINFFSLDVEGSENLVLKTIDFSKVMIDVIMIEIANQHCRKGCEVREQVRQKMSTEGYLRYEGLIPKSDIYVHPKSLYQLPTTYTAASAPLGLHNRTRE